MQVEKIQFETIDSTNKWAKENLTTLKPDTLHIVRADEQTAGYGRRGHKWVAPKGKNLLITFAFHFNGSPHDLTQKICQSLVQTLGELSFSPQIKTPNDLLLNGKKIAGVICEVTGKNAYLGLGLNVNTTKEELASIPQPTTSLFIEKGRLFDIDKIESTLVKYFLCDR